MTATEEWIRTEYNAPYRAHPNYKGGLGVTDREGRVAGARSKWRRRRWSNLRNLGSYGGIDFRTADKYGPLPYGASDLPTLPGTPVGPAAAAAAAAAAPEPPE